MQQIYQHINLLREEWLHLALSAALAGVVLPYDQFGLNLDDSGKKKDADIERKIFQKAGEALCNFSFCGQQRLNIRAIIMERFLPGPLLLKRSTESGIQLASIGEKSVKDNNIYTNHLQTMAFLHLKPTSYEQVELPYDLFFPSVRKKLKGKRGSRYQCNFAKCRKIFNLAKLHLKLTGDKKLAMKAIQEDDNTEPESDAEPTEDDPFINIESFLKKQFEKKMLRRQLKDLFYLILLLRVSIVKLYCKKET